MVVAGVDGDPCGIFPVLFDLSGPLCSICVAMHPVHPLRESGTPLENQFSSGAEVWPQFSEALLPLGVFGPELVREPGSQGT